MRIALCSSFVPFIHGGARQIVEWLQTMLEKEGHQVERVYLPQTDDPDLLVRQMAAFRWVDLTAADRVICFRPQAHLIPHPHKVLWFIHHIRLFYDLWDSQYRGFPDDAKHRAIREALVTADNAGLAETKKVFPNSQVVSQRLKKFNGIDSEVLYPPVFARARFHSRRHNDEIVYICRMEHHKRQHLLVEAMKYTKTDVRLRLCGSSGSHYSTHIRELIERDRLADRVVLDERWITEDEKVERLADCLAAAYLPLDEDSYGYPSVEASHAKKPVLTTTDSGGVLELVVDGHNGYVASPDPISLAESMDRLYVDRAKTAQMGQAALARLAELEICWSHVLQRLLA